jgi:NADPH:quinone reductase
MYRMVCTAYGPPESLTLVHEATPAPGPHQVLVEVGAAGVNYVDALFVAGSYQIKIPPPFTPGFEAAGRVIVCGDQVHDVTVGQRVLITPGIGAYASHLIARTDQLVALADSFDDARAATFTQSYATCWFALTNRTQVRAGETVLVLGAGGGIGQAAIDVAKSLGANVIAAASSDDKLMAATAMGADHTINYLTEDLKTAAKELSDGGVDVVIDPIGGAVAEPALRATGWNGRYVVIGFVAGISSLPTNLMLLNNRTMVGVDWGAWAGRNRDANRAMLIELVARVGGGQLHPTAPMTAPLSTAGQVLRDALERRLVGKVALVPD